MPQRIHDSKFRILHYPVREVIPYINWIYYFHAWGMEPRFAAIADVHNCPSCRASWVASFPAEEQAKAREAMKLYDEALELLRQWADEPMCHALFLLAEAYSEGDDIIVDGKVRIPFLRQQQADKSGYTLCLSDFIKGKNENEDGYEDGNEDGNENQPSEGSLLSVNSQPSTLKFRANRTLNQVYLNYAEVQPKLNNRVVNFQLSTLNPQPSTLNPKQEHDTANTIGLFATTVSQPVNSQLSTLNFQLSTLSDRLAEATAEKMHEEVRKHHWGYAKEEQLTMRELHSEQFQGIRPAVGYPSLPDQSINFLIDELLHLEKIGITLSENGAMHPHCSVSGFMIAHPKAHYFAIGTIGDDQLRDYAHRRQLSVEQVEKFLIKNL